LAKPGPEPADIAVQVEVDAAGPEQLAPAEHHVLLELDARDAVDEEAPIRS
jgi:hypothetical protein